MIFGSVPTIFGDPSQYFLALPQYYGKPPYIFYELAKYFLGRFNRISGPMKQSISFRIHFAILRKESVELSTLKIKG
jgi:hypothetical protein